MVRIPYLAALVAAPLIALALVALGATSASAHARYERSDPPAGGMVDASPPVLRAWFTQELMLRSAIVVVDGAGAQVDLGDGRVDQDDPDRKSMVVSLPELPVGVYTVYWLTSSAEDGDDEAGSFTFGVGMMPTSADTADSPASTAMAGWPAAPCHGEL